MYPCHEFDYGYGFHVVTQILVYEVLRVVEVNPTRYKELGLHPKVICKSYLSVLRDPVSDFNYSRLELRTREPGREARYGALRPNQRLSRRQPRLQIQGSVGVSERSSTVRFIVTRRGTTKSKCNLNRRRRHRKIKPIRIRSSKRALRGLLQGLRGDSKGKRADSGITLRACVLIA